MGRHTGLSLLLGEGKRQKKFMLIGGFALIFINLLEIVLPLTVKGGIDSVSAGELSSLRYYIFAYLIIAMFQMALRATWRVVLANSVADSGHNFRSNLMQHTLSLAPAEVENNKIGTLLSISNSDTEASSRVYDLGVLFLIDTAVPLIGVPITMYFIAPSLLLYILLPLPLIPFLALRRDKMVQREHAKTQSELGDLSGYVRESFAGVRAIRAFVKENYFSKTFEDKSEIYAGKALRLVSVEAGFGPIIELTLVASFVLLYIFGGKEVLAGTITIGTFVAFHRYTQQMMWPTQALGLTIAVLRKGRTSADRIASIMNLNPEEIREQKRSDFVAKGKLTVSNLNFSRKLGTHALKDIKFELEAGERLAVLGDVGSGKSTLLEVVSGIEPLTSGSIYFNEIEISKLDLKEFRAYFSYVSQSLQLFNTTVRENILLGARDDQRVSDEELIKVCKLAEIYNEIETFEKGFNTLLGERGVVLSGGQKQRLCLARALLKPAPILVLDGFLSSVDTKTEERILSNLAQVGSTIIFTTQRPSSLQIATKFIVLKDGEIIEHGDLNSNGALQNVWFERFLNKEESGISEVSDVQSR